MRVDETKDVRVACSAVVSRRRWAYTAEEHLSASLGLPSGSVRTGGWKKWEDEEGSTVERTSRGPSILAVFERSSKVGTGSCDGGGEGSIGTVDRIVITERCFRGTWT